MTVKQTIICDECGKQIDTDKDAAVEVITRGKGAIAADEGDYCDFHCLIVWIIKNKPGAMQLYPRHDAPKRPVKDVPQA